MSISLQLQQSGDEKRRSPGSIPPRRVWKPLPHWLVVDWLRLMEPAHGEGCLSGQRRRPTAPGEYRVPSPVYKSFHIPTTSTTWGRKRRSPGSIMPRRVRKPQPHWLYTDWMRLMEPAHGESCPCGQRRGPAAPGEDNVLSLDQKSLHISTALTTRGRKQRSPGPIPPRAVLNAHPIN